jgi:hypothetical protein
MASTLTRTHSRAQNDTHIPQLSVLETLAFAHECQHGSAPEDFSLIHEVRDGGDGLYSRVRRAQGLRIRPCSAHYWRAASYWGCKLVLQRFR